MEKKDEKKESKEVAAKPEVAPNQRTTELLEEILTENDNTAEDMDD